MIIKTAANLDQAGQYHAADRIDRAIALRTPTRIAMQTAEFFKLLAHEAPNLRELSPAVLENMEKEYSLLASSGHADKALDALKALDTDESQNALGTLQKMSRELAPGKSNSDWLTDHKDGLRYDADGLEHGADGLEHGADGLEHGADGLEHVHNAADDLEFNPDDAKSSGGLFSGARERFKGYAKSPKQLAVGVGALGLAGAGATGLAQMGKGGTAANAGTTITDTTVPAPGAATGTTTGATTVPATGGGENGWMGYGAAMLKNLGFEKATNQLQHDMQASKVPQGYIDNIMRTWHMHYDGQQSVIKEMGQIPGAGNLGLYPPRNARPTVAPTAAPATTPGAAGTQGSSVGAQPKITQ